VHSQFLDSGIATLLRANDLYFKKSLAATESHGQYRDPSPIGAKVQLSRLRSAITASKFSTVTIPGAFAETVVGGVVGNSINKANIG
jgi:hypothetical protein